jgi:(p)ppGpp synthase/HD superfamily hydrolase
MNLPDRALAFATAAHGEQKRKYTGNPYIEHPIRVAQLVKEAGGTEEMIAAAYLHDVVEDVSLEKIKELCGITTLIKDHSGFPESERSNKLHCLAYQFGHIVASLVEMVTDVSLPTDGNRKARKQKDLEHLAQASPEGKTIKLADLIDNSRDIVKNDPDFAKVYMKEKAALLPVLIGGNDKLWMRAKTIVKAWEEHELGEDGSK